MFVYVLAMAASVGLVASSAYLFRRFGPDNGDREPDGPTAGHAGSMLSAFFLLAFAIAIVVPWTTNDAARQNTYAEGQAAVEAYWAAAELPAPADTEVRAALRDYTQHVIDKEWPLMASGRLSDDGWARLERLRVQVTGLTVKTDKEEEAQATVLEQVRDLTTARRQRAVDADSRPPAGLLAITVVTGALVVLFPFIAGARPRGTPLVAFVAMAALLGLGVWLCFDISRVFTGALAVEPDAFRTALGEFLRIPSGG